MRPGIDTGETFESWSADLDDRRCPIAKEGSDAVRLLIFGSIGGCLLIGWVALIVSIANYIKR